VMRTINIIGVGMLAAALAQAQAPVITGGPVNAASYVIRGLPNANIAQGSMFVLFGNNIGPAKIANAFAFPLPTTLSDTSIQVTVGGTATKAIMLFTVSSQVAAILPSTTPIGSGTLTLTFNGQTSNAVPINVVASTLGIFTRNQSGSGPGVLFNFNSQSDQPLNSLVQAAHPGQVLTLWGTGLGAVSGHEANGPLPGNLDVPVTVYVGTTPVTPTYKGRSGCCAGIDQVVFTMPDGVEGCYVSVNVVAGGVVSNSATIAVTSSGSVCSDPTGFSTSDLQKMQNGQPLTIGEIAIYRLHAMFSAPGLGSTQGSIDFGEGRFRNYITSLDVLGSARGSLAALGGLPSVGSCTVSPFTFSDFFSSILDGGGDPVNFGGLDAGPVLNINGPNGLKQLPRQNQGTAAQPFYRYHVHGNVIGGSIPRILSGGPAYLDPGNYKVDNGAGGGSQVGAFTANLMIPSSSPVWTNEDALSNIPRTQDITINWTGGTVGGVVAVLGSAADPSTGAGAKFQCLTQAEAGTFVVPAWVLSALPQSGVDPVAGVAVGFLLLGTTLPQPARFEASGIDIGYFNWATLEVKNVVFQ
jgi:uncharacterized protein (TIGR03437 family)